MQLPLETVRDVAQILSESGLGEISIESTGPGPLTRLTISRPVVLTSALGVDLDEEAVEEVEPVAKVEVSPQEIVVTSTAVGVYRAAKPPLVAGDEVKRKQLVATVEALKIPNEIYATAHASVVEVLVADGQGVEWGQPLMVLKPLDGAV